jgi:hypothetical protein
VCIPNNAFANFSLQARSFMMAMKKRKKYKHFSFSSYRNSMSTESQYAQSAGNTKWLLVILTKNHLTEDKQYNAGIKIELNYFLNM